MSVLTITGLVALALLAGAAGWLLISRRLQLRKEGQMLTLSATPADAQSEQEVPPEPISEVWFGQSPDQPLVTLSALVGDESFSRSQPIPAGASVVALVDSLLQAAPPIGVAAAHHTRKLMEVQISGPMLRAADGNGYLAMSTGAKGRIAEHGRLFGTEGLKKAVSAAAVWQVASLVVAQKHMADITEKLGEIDEGVQRTNQFLDQQRMSHIKGAYDYLKELGQAIQKGELPDSAWLRLEPMELELRSIREHLNSEFQSVLSRDASDPDSFGTRGLTKNINRKFEELQSLVQTMELCLKTRLLLCYMRSLYPRESTFTRLRLDSLLDEVRGFNLLWDEVGKVVVKELERINSHWNREVTLKGRREAVIQTSRELEKCIESSVASGTRWGGSVQQLVLNEESTRLLVEVVDGKVGQVRLAQQEAVIMAPRG